MYFFTFTTSLRQLTFTTCGMQKGRTRTVIGDFEPQNFRRVDFCTIESFWCTIDGDRSGTASRGGFLSARNESERKSLAGVWMTLRIVCGRQAGRQALALFLSLFHGLHDLVACTLERLKESSEIRDSTRAEGFGIN